MKKYFYIFTLFAVVCLQAGVTDTPFATTIDECKTDIYFGNGVWNDIDSAASGQDKLNGVIKREIIKDDPNSIKKYGEVKLQYNWGKGSMEDVLETYYQLKEAGQLGNAGFYETIAVLTLGRLSPILATAGSIALWNKMRAVATTEQANVDQMITDYYLESFQWSHRVLLVSHSQGNLFANRVYDSFDPAGYKDYFANVQVGSPASSIHASMGD